ncbi:hypothetical protein CRG98_002365 [Punica granatum]|uniref:Reverse transcriptase domain-containing protein n=1 Tax=Punica granatum TaxID=22663 RepID=A0A2I0L972_PUNGR|nr:hypothetical protein CRG98_002365 [Punica granatum]
MWSISAYTLSRALKHPPSSIDLEPDSSSVLRRGGTLTRGALLAALGHTGPGVDDKFPLPNKQALFNCLSQAKVFSKFDLKAGFWQLGFHPEDKPKSRFCILNTHYQGKVMLFGLKTTSSLFQKAMCRIFSLIMDHAFVYIDDILLFGPIEEAHVHLLQQFSDIVLSYGIMLFDKKMVIGQKEIQFLEMKLANGQY